MAEEHALSADMKIAEPEIPNHIYTGPKHDELNIFTGGDDEMVIADDGTAAAGTAAAAAVPSQPPASAPTPAKKPEPIDLEADELWEGLRGPAPAAPRPSEPAPPAPVATPAPAPSPAPAPVARPPAEQEKAKEPAALPKIRHVFMSSPKPSPAPTPGAAPLTAWQLANNFVTKFTYAPVSNPRGPLTVEFLAAEGYRSADHYTPAEAAALINTPVARGIFEGGTVMFLGAAVPYGREPNCELTLRHFTWIMLGEDVKKPGAVRLRSKFKTTVFPALFVRGVPNGGGDMFCFHHLGNMVKVFAGIPAALIAEHDNKMRVKSKWQPDGVEIPIIPPQVYIARPPSKAKTITPTRKRVGGEMHEIPEAKMRANFRKRNGLDPDSDVDDYAEVTDRLKGMLCAPYDVETDFLGRAHDANFVCADSDDDEVEGLGGDVSEDEELPEETVTLADIQMIKSKERKKDMMDVRKHWLSTCDGIMSRNHKRAVRRTKQAAKKGGGINLAAAEKTLEQYEGMMEATFQGMPGAWGRTIIQKMSKAANPVFNPGDSLDAKTVVRPIPPAQCEPLMQKVLGMQQAVAEATAYDFTYQRIEKPSQKNVAARPEKNGFLHDEKTQATKQQPPPPPQQQQKTKEKEKEKMAPPPPAKKPADKASASRTHESVVAYDDDDIFLHPGMQAVADAPAPTRPAGEVYKSKKPNTAPAAPPPPAEKPSAKKSTKETDAHVAKKRKTSASDDDDAQIIDDDVPHVVNEYDDDEDAEDQEDDGRSAQDEGDEEDEEDDEDMDDDGGFDDEDDDAMDDDDDDGGGHSAKKDKKSTKPAAKAPAKKPRSRNRPVRPARSTAEDAEIAKVEAEIESAVNALTDADRTARSAREGLFMAKQELEAKVKTAEHVAEQLREKVEGLKKSLTALKAKPKPAATATASAGRVSAVDREIAASMRKIFDTANANPSDAPPAEFRKWLLTQVSEKILEYWDGTPEKLVAAAAKVTSDRKTFERKKNDALKKAGKTADYALFPGNIPIEEVAGLQFHKSYVAMAAFFSRYDNRKTPILPIESPKPVYGCTPYRHFLRWMAKFYTPDSDPLLQFQTNRGHPRFKEVLDEFCFKIAFLVVRSHEAIERFAVTRKLATATFTKRAEEDKKAASKPPVDDAFDLL